MIEVILTHTRRTLKYYVFANDGAANAPVFGNLYIHQNEIPMGVSLGQKIKVHIEPVEEKVKVPEPQPRKGAYVDDEFRRIGRFNDILDDDVPF